MAGALLPPLSRAIRENDHVKFQQFLNFSIRRTLALMLPLTIFLFTLGDSCIQLLYGRGDFDHKSVAGTTLALWGYTVGLIPMAFVMILAPAFYAKKEYRIPSLASIASMLLNLILNAVLVAGFGLGAASIAFATSLSAWLNFLLLNHFLKKNQQDLAFYSLSNLNTWKIAITSLSAGSAALLFDFFFWNNFSALAIFLNTAPSYPFSTPLQLLHLASLGLTFALTLGCFAWFLQAKDLTRFVSNAS